MTAWEKVCKKFEDIWCKALRYTYIKGDFEKVKTEGNKMQSQIQAALKGIEEWCSDCLKPKYSCPSCVWQLTKEELGYRPRLSHGETSINGE